MAWEYYFYAELVGDCSGAAAQALLEKLGAVPHRACLAYTAAARQKGALYEADDAAGPAKL